METLAEQEARLIRAALERYGNDQQAVLTALGINLRALEKKAKTHGIVLPWRKNGGV